MVMMRDDYRDFLCCLFKGKPEETRQSGGCMTGWVQADYYF